MHIYSRSILIKYCTYPLADLFIKTSIWLHYMCTIHNKTTTVPSRSWHITTLPHDNPSQPRFRPPEHKSNVPSFPELTCFTSVINFFPFCSTSVTPWSISLYFCSLCWTDESVIWVGSTFSIFRYCSSASIWMATWNNQSLNSDLGRVNLLYLQILLKRIHLDGHLKQPIIEQWSGSGQPSLSLDTAQAHPSGWPPETTNHWTVIWVGSTFSIFRYCSSASIWMATWNNQSLNSDLGRVNLLYL